MEKNEYINGIVLIDYLSLFISKMILLRKWCYRVTKYKFGEEKILDSRPNRLHFWFFTRDAFAPHLNYFRE